MAKGQTRSGKEPLKPKAVAKKKSGSLGPAQHNPDSPKAAKEPSAMYKLFTKNRSVS